MQTDDASSEFGRASPSPASSVLCTAGSLAGGGVIHYEDLAALSNGRDFRFVEGEDGRGMHLKTRKALVEREGASRRKARATVDRSLVLPVSSGGRKWSLISAACRLTQHFGRDRWHC